MVASAAGVGALDDGGASDAEAPLPRGPHAPPPLRLYCLGGGEAPPDLGADLLRLSRFPVEALQKIWQVLAPSLAEKLSPETEQLLDVFCSAYRVDDMELGRAIKACRFLIREAAGRDVPAGALAADLERLCPDEPLLEELVLAGYEPAKAHLRREMVKAAVADHGKLLTGVSWRVDAIQTSERGAKLGTPVAMLTLHYLKGAKTGRVTFQVLPDVMGELKQVCEKVLG
jgi:hypothetical protein